jgi:hypothetical protein
MSGWVRVGIVFFSIFLGFVAIIAIKLFRNYAFPYVFLPIGCSVLGLIVVFQTALGSDVSSSETQTPNMVPDSETVDSFGVEIFVLVAGVVLSGAICYFGLQLFAAVLSGAGGARVR